MLNLEDVEKDALLGIDYYDINFSVVGNVADIKDAIQESFENGDDILPVYTIEKIKQKVTKYTIEDMYDSFEENGGFEDQAERCMEDLSEEDIKTVINILNKPLENNPSYWRIKEVNVDNYVKSLKDKHEQTNKKS